MLKILSFLTVIAYMATAQPSSTTSAPQMERHKNVLSCITNEGIFIKGINSTRIDDAGIEQLSGKRDYFFMPRGPGVAEKENLVINGQPATVYYHQGGVRVEFDDSSILIYENNDGSKKLMGRLYN